LNGMEEHVCAVCDKLIFDHERTLFHRSNIEHDFLESMLLKHLISLQSQMDYISEFFLMNIMIHKD
jgi:hypothetical protein